MEDPRARRHLGEIVGRRYLIDRLVGEGSFAWVFHALDKSGRDVAIKILHSEDPSAGLRFAREVRVLKALPRNVHVAGYLDDGRARDGRPLLVLEFVDGITLKAGMEGRSRVKPDRAVAFLAELCEAFVGLHQLGVAHRDVKPENILLARSGGIKLIDFGLIRDAQGILQLLEEEEESLGERLFADEVDTGVLAGTPEYMAPEQFSDATREDVRRGQTDTSSDVFSLGVILFQLLTGTKPFPMREVPSEDYPRELLRYFHHRIRLTDDNLPPMAEVPPSLQSIVHKALRTAPKRRQPDARALMGDLHRYRDTGRGVYESDDSRTVSVAVDQIFRPDSSTDEIQIEPPLAPPGHLDPPNPFDPTEDIDAGLPALYADSEDEITAVHGDKGRKKRRQQPPRRGGSHTALFFEQDGVSTVTDRSGPESAGTNPITRADVVPTEVSTAPDQLLMPVDTSMQPGPRPATKRPAPAGAPKRKRSDMARRIARKEEPSIFEQDTRRVNVAEILPDEVKAPKPQKR